MSIYGNIILYKDVSDDCTQQVLMRRGVAINQVYNTTLYINITLIACCAFVCCAVLPRSQVTVLVGLTWRHVAWHDVTPRFKRSRNHDLVIKLVPGHIFKENLIAKYFAQSGIVEKNFPYIKNFQKNKFYTPFLFDIYSAR